MTDRYEILGCMIAGDGRAALNCVGGFGYDRTIRKMVEKGEVTITRPPGRSNPFTTSGYPTINRTYAHVTDIGRAAYISLKKRKKL